uniref:Artemin n=1 Tax=Neogobius melanostomus TaxID=47308 RepID=A0A8C6U8J2_9GOBI
KNVGKFKPTQLLTTSLCPVVASPLAPALSPLPLDPPCALRSVLVRVRGLGLGYESDEEVLFKFCSGACPHHRSNHDLALSALLQSGLLPAGGAAAAAAAPCCRPTHHEDVAFLDNHHRWHKVEKLSAAACHCVG